MQALVTIPTPILNWVMERRIEKTYSSTPVGAPSWYPKTGRTDRDQGNTAPPHLCWNHHIIFILPAASIGWMSLVYSVRIASWLISFDIISFQCISFHLQYEYMWIHNSNLAWELTRASSCNSLYMVNSISKNARLSSAASILFREWWVVIWWKQSTLIRRK